MGFGKFVRRSGIRGIFLYVLFLYVFVWCLRDRASADRNPSENERKPATITETQGRGSRHKGVAARNAGVCEINAHRNLINMP